MPSLVEKILPGYNTAMVFWIMVAAIAAFLSLSWLRTNTYPGDFDILHGGIVGSGLLVIILAQTTVWNVKAVRNAPKDEQPAAFALLARYLLAFVWIIALIAAAAFVVAIIIWLRNDQPYAKPWSTLTISYGIGMVGMAVDYEEWRRITVLRSQNSLEKFRFPDMLHNGLNLATYGVCLIGAIWCMVVYFHLRNLTAKV